MPIEITEPRVGHVVEHQMYGKIGHILSITDTHAVVSNPNGMDPLRYELSAFNKWWMSYQEPECIDCHDDGGWWEMAPDGIPDWQSCNCQHRAGYASDVDDG